MINWHGNSAGHYKIQINIKNINKQKKNFKSPQTEALLLYTNRDGPNLFERVDIFVQNVWPKLTFPTKKLLNIFISQEDSRVDQASAAAICVHYNIMACDGHHELVNKSLWKFRYATNSWHISSFLVIILYELKHTDECNLWTGVLNLSKQLVLLPLFCGS